MPVMGASPTPTVNISVPVPTPVQQPRRQPRPQPVPGGTRPSLPPAPQMQPAVRSQPTPTAFILPYLPSQQRRMSRSPRKYAKLPPSESGKLSPEQVAIAQQGHDTGDATAWGALGDHLAESGFPGSGGVLSRFAEGHPQATGRPAAPGGVHNFPPSGRFSFTVLRDGSDLLHYFRLRLPTGEGYVFTHRVRPVDRMRRELPRRRLAR